jgi:hypothetical protein
MAVLSKVSMWVGLVTGAIGVIVVWTTVPEVFPVTFAAGEGISGFG